MSEAPTPSQPIVSDGEAAMIRGTHRPRRCCGQAVGASREERVTVDNPGDALPSYYPLYFTLNE